MPPLTSGIKSTYLFDVVACTNVDDDVLRITQFTGHIQRVREWDENSRSYRNAVHLHMRSKNNQVN